jgi:O-antigen ligase
MTYKAHIKNRLDVYSLLISWALVGMYLPKAVAIFYSILTFVLVLRTRDLTKISLPFLAMLIFSDSRSAMFSFAETAKIGVVVFSLVFVWLNFSRLRSKENMIFKYFLPFLLFAISATLWSYDPFNALQKAMSYGLIFFLIPLFYLNAKEENEQYGLELVYFFTTVVLVGLIIHLVNPQFTTLVGRYRGLLGNPNGLGIFLTVMYAVAFPVFKSLGKEGVNRAFLWLFYGGVIVSLLMTGSRTALIAFSLFFIFDRLRFLSNAFTIVVFVALILSYEYLLLNLPELISFFGLEDYFRIDTLEEGSGRFIAWSFAWERIQDVFFIGGGFSYTEHIFHVFYDELSRLGHQGNAHNSYLTIWLDTGVIGIVLFAAGLIRSIAAALKQSPITLPIVYAVLFSTFFESWLSASLNPFTSLLIIALTVLSVPQRTETSLEHVP